MATGIRVNRAPGSRRGQAALLITLSLVPIVGMLGLVVDIGYAYYRKVLAKTAAQSATIAAIMAVQSASSWGTCNSNGLTCQNATACPASPSTPPSNNIMNGCLYAKQNGFVNSGNQTVTMEAHGPDGTTPPGTTISPAYWVSTTITENLPQLFSAVLGKTSAKVAVRSISAVFLSAAGACIYALDPANTGFDASGTPDVEAQCGIYVDSNDSSAMLVGGSTAIVNSTVIKIVGNYDTHGHPTINPTPSVGQPITPDPFASVSLPTVPNRCDTSNSLADGITMPADGFYVDCGGGFSMDGNPTVTLPAGIYVLKGGSIDLHNGTLTGSGVTFYMTGSFSGVTINGNVNINLSAPTSGSLKGLLFFQDRTLAVGAFSSKINGGSNTILNGSLYFPTTDVTYSGGSSTTTSYTALVAYDVAFRGTSYFAADPYGAHTGLGGITYAFIE